jgi:hypothetical protein
MMEINAHMIVPANLLQVMSHLLGPLNCCADKVGIKEAAVYVYDNKSYCLDCLQKLANELEANKEEPTIEETSNQ